MAHHVTTVAVDPAPPRPGYDGHSDGYTHVATVGPEVGSVHLDQGMSVLAPGGRIDQHLHSNEEAFYVVDGVVDLFAAGDRHRLGAGHYGFVPVGAVHAWRNPGLRPARWIEVAAPQAPTDGRRHTFFTGAHAPTGPAPAPDLASPLTRHLGWWAGVAQRDPFTGRGATGMDVGVTESPPGVHVKQLVNAQLGACLVQLIMCEFAPGTGLHDATHDHCYEESYVLLDGVVEGRIGALDVRFAAGDAWWVGVGTPHTWANGGDMPVRWIEAQCPQPPRRHSYRWTSQWEELGRRLG